MIPAKDLGHYIKIKIHKSTFAVALAIVRGFGLMGRPLMIGGLEEKSRMNLFLLDKGPRISFFFSRFPSYNLLVNGKGHATFTK